MTLYETLFIIHPDHVARAKEFVDRFRQILEGLQGVVSQADEWGLKDMAYRIQKQTRGYYILLRYRATSAAVQELERNMKLTDGVMRYLSVRLEEEPKESSAPPQSNAPGGVRRSDGEGLEKREQEP